MANPIVDSKAHAAYNFARFKAQVSGLLALLQGKPNRLLSYDDVREKLRVGGPIYRGVRQVPISQIAGSVDRYQDFNRAFLPLTDATHERWRSISRAFFDAVSLPPVLLYQVGEVYFVVDGNHRVSVAREQGALYIDAEVRECSVRVPLTPDITADDLVRLGEKVDFLERTELDKLRPDTDLTITVLGGYERILEHIAVHRYFMGLDFARDIPREEAIAHWHDEVFGPIVRVICESKVMQGFPKRTPADLYLWVLDHQHWLVSEQGEAMRPPVAAAETFVEMLSTTHTRE